MRVAALVCALLMSGSVHAQRPQQRPLRIAAAADLQPILPALTAAFEQKTGVRAEVSFASSATLAEQILNGAPFDLFLAADFSYPERVVAAGKATGAAPVPYARGTLVLWARRDSALQPITIDSLRDARLKKLAVANDLHAPYGRAAVEALRHLGVYDALQPRLVVAENIAQAAQFADSGNAQAGLISLTAALSPHFREAGSFVLVPPQTYLPLRQCAVVMKASVRASEAQRFLDFLREPETRQRMHAAGLEGAD